MSWPATVAVVALTLGVGVDAVKLVPGSMTSRIRWLGTYHATGPDPFWDTPVDGTAFRRAGRMLGRDSTYFLWYPSSNPQYQHDLLAAGLLFLTPAVPVGDPRHASWILSYRTSRLVPTGVTPTDARAVAENVFLVRVRAG